MTDFFFQNKYFSLIEKRKNLTKIFICLSVVFEYITRVQSHLFLNPLVGLKYCMDHNDFGSSVHYQQMLLHQQFVQLMKARFTNVESITLTENQHLLSSHDAGIVALFIGAADTFYSIEPQYLPHLGKAIFQEYKIFQWSNVAPPPPAQWIGSTFLTAVMIGDALYGVSVNFDTNTLRCDYMIRPVDSCPVICLGKYTCPVTTAVIAKALALRGHANKYEKMFHNYFTNSKTNVDPIVIDNNGWRVMGTCKTRNNDGSVTVVDNKKTRIYHALPEISLHIMHLALSCVNEIGIWYRNEWIDVYTILYFQSDNQLWYEMDDDFVDYMDRVDPYWSPCQIPAYARTIMLEDLTFTLCRQLKIKTGYTRTDPNDSDDDDSKPINLHTISPK
jgi:hypothetical protein